jgi:ATP-binding cassette, subfamily B, bacterial MsbA
MVVKALARLVKENRPLWRTAACLVLATLSLPMIAGGLAVVEREIVDSVIAPGGPGFIWQLLGAYAGLWLLMSAINLVAAPLCVYLSERLCLNYRLRLLERCTETAFNSGDHSGQTLALISNDVPNVSRLCSSTFLTGVAGVTAIAVGLFVMVQLNWQLGVAAGLIPPIAGGLAAVVTRPLRPAARRVQEKAAELTERAQEMLGGVRETVAHGQEKSQRSRLSETMRQLLGLRMRLTVMEAGMGTGQSLFSLAVSLVILGYGGYLVATQQTTLGVLVATRTLFGMVFQPAAQIINVVAAIQKETTSLDRVYAFLDEGEGRALSAGSLPVADVQGRVDLDRVSYSYDGDRLALNEVSLRIPAGAVVALVGPSGAGKTTLASLIARFRDPTSGTVRLDGHDMSELRLEDVRRHIGVVFQDPFLFSDTIRSNIAFGRQDATESEVVAAARSANAWEFIERLPNGLDTQVGERGVCLSEGQKQRVALARAFLRDPSILILDEPTASLDARTENLVQAALRQLMRGRTTIVIAHRLSTVRSADQILVLEHGSVVEQGTHSELIAQGGLYRTLCSMQFEALTGDPHETEPDTLGGAMPELVESVPALGGWNRWDDRSFA